MPATQKPALGDAIAAIIRGAQRDPFSVLGPHADGAATVVRAFQPAAKSIALRLVETNTLVPMTKTDPAGMFEARLPGRDGQVGRVGQAGEPADYRLRITYAGDQVEEIDDPYRYGRVLSDFDLHLLSEGTQYRAFDKKPTDI